MIRLDTTTRSIILTLDAPVTNNQFVIVTNYSDNNGISYIGGTKATLSNDTNQVTICTAPALNVVRDIDAITIYNNDTVQQVVNVFLNDNATLYQMVNTNLQPSDSLVWTHGQGWKAIDINGATKTTIYSQVASNLVGTPLLPNGVTGFTQTTGDTSNALATDLFVANAIAAYTVAHPPITNTINTTTANLGTIPCTSGTFNITGLSGLTPGVVVMVNLSPDQSSITGDFSYDVIEMDPIIATGICISTSTIQVNWSCLTGVLGSYNFNYWI